MCSPRKNETSEILIRIITSGLLKLLKNSNSTEFFFTMLKVFKPYFPSLFFTSSFDKPFVDVLSEVRTSDSVARAYETVGLSNITIIVFQLNIVFYMNVILRV